MTKKDYYDKFRFSNFLLDEPFTCYFCDREMTTLLCIDDYSDIYICDDCWLGETND